MELAPVFAAIDRSRLLALLIKQLRDFTLAEEALQDAFLSAIEHWSKRGVPANADAWLMQVARRKAIDRLRKDQNWARKSAEVLRLAELDQWTDDNDSEVSIPDERLTLIFACCHPALDRNASVALTLRTLCGLTTEEIARAFLVSRETMAQRLVRVQGKILAARIPYQVPGPEQLAERLETVLTVIYLIFNEGYAASGTKYMRRELCDEALRLAKLVAAQLPEAVEAQGLCSLLMLHRSRFETRIDPDGVPISLEAQDRSRWDRAAIAEAIALLGDTLKSRRPGPYQLQAAIAALHCEAPDFADTDWPQIAALYGKLAEITDNKIHVLNQCVAQSYFTDTASVIARLEVLASYLVEYQPYHAAVADICMRAGRVEIARVAFLKAVALSTSKSEIAFLQRRLDSLERP